MTTPIVPSISDEELESVRASAERSATGYACLHHTSYQAIIARLRAAEADAKRYRWMRNPSTDPASVIDKRVGDSVTGFGIWEYKAGDELDAAIDAAMERTP